MDNMQVTGYVYEMAIVQGHLQLQRLTVAEWWTCPGIRTSVCNGDHLSTLAIVSDHSHDEVGQSWLALDNVSVQIIVRGAKPTLTGLVFNVGTSSGWLGSRWVCARKHCVILCGKLTRDLTKFFTCRVIDVNGCTLISVPTYDVYYYSDSEPVW